MNHIAPSGPRAMPRSARTPVLLYEVTAPLGVMFDTVDQMQRQAAKIKERAIASKNMPLANVTEMTPEERATLGAWIEQGAKGP